MDGCPEQHEASPPPHLVDLYSQAKENCADLTQEEWLSDLLVRYQDVFSKGADDVGRTTLVKHSIPVAEGTRPIRQPPHRLGPEKKAEKQAAETEGAPSSEETSA